MVQFDILDSPIFLSWTPYVLLVADAPITIVSYVVASVIKTFSWF
jgi:hypothetical protein